MKIVSHKFNLETLELIKILDIPSRATARKTCVLNGDLNRRFIGTGSSGPLLISIYEVPLFNHRCGSIRICSVIEEWLSASADPSRFLVRMIETEPLIAEGDEDEIARAIVESGERISHWFISPFSDSVSLFNEICQAPATQRHARSSEGSSLVLADSRTSLLSNAPQWQNRHLQPLDCLRFQRYRHPDENFFRQDIMLHIFGL
jgi:hypothetical protein